MSKKALAPLLTLAIILGLCSIGVVISFLSPRNRPARNVSTIVPSITFTPEPAVAGFGKRSIMITAFSINYDFADWERFGDYEQGKLPNGQAIVIFHNDPVTKASLVINRGISNGGKLIGSLLTVTNTDPAAIDWITQHLNGGGETTIGQTHILIEDDTATGRVIVEFEFVH